MTTKELIDILLEKNQPDWEVVFISEDFNENKNVVTNNVTGVYIDNLTKTVELWTNYDC